MHAAAIPEIDENTDWFERHRERFEAAALACRTRECWSPFPDLPSKYPDTEAAQARGLAAFNARLRQPFRFDPAMPGGARLEPALHEVSPYTREPLGISYLMPTLDPLFNAATNAMPRWAEADPEQRIGVLMEVVQRLYTEHLFEIAQAVMHTAGQSFNMAYAGSSINALDRAIEALGKT